MIVIDASGLILGRLSSMTAKRLLEGETVSIVNAEKVIISGSATTTFNEYLQATQRGIKEQGPYYPKRPDMILKRTVRGMLPHKRRRGRNALSHLKVYVGEPVELKREARSKLEGTSMKRLSTIKHIGLDDLSRQLGGKF
ncbi:MAG: 50S ribosomal protein L13 [Methanosarcinales archaeon]|uniref:Large ribosomal subunit protein uL13 n=1 Tax=Candidatus Ethanoperedens thermophilum TaxID=2766897 RepID=A0A848D795_9EURY|nr:50S ribosomal protein L13 [Candidatus Ethanoperedens thermophilum]